MTAKTIAKKPFQKVIAADAGQGRFLEASCLKLQPSMGSCDVAMAQQCDVLCDVLGVLGDLCVSTSG